MQKPLRVTENILWAVLILLLLGLVFAILFGYVSHALPGFPAVAEDNVWPIVGGVMGGIVLLMAGLWWWWGRIMKDRADARRYADEEDEEPAE